MGPSGHNRDDGWAFAGVGKRDSLRLPPLPLLTWFPPVGHDLGPDYWRWMVIPEEMRSRFWSLPARLGNRVYP